MSANAIKEVDILIVGGGLIGATLMLALANTPYRICLVDKYSYQMENNPLDTRALALSQTSQRILNMLSIWDEIKEQATAIERIHVSKQGAFGSTRLNNSEQFPLGFVVEHRSLHQAISALLNPDTLQIPATLVGFDADTQIATVETPSGIDYIKAKLFVAADGSHSSLRSHSGLSVHKQDYNQTAIATAIQLARAHHFQAFERFTPAGVMAFLPLTQNRCGNVWVVDSSTAKNLITLEESAFIHELQQTFGYRLGKFLAAGKRVSFPLVHYFMPQQTAFPFVFLGNAAHTLHPIAGQGFNLGLRDVAALAECIVKQGINAQMLDTYASMRKQDQNIITKLTNSLISVFRSKYPGLDFARQLGLLAMDNLPFVKQQLIHYAQGFGGMPSDLICKIPLDFQQTRGQ